MDSGSSQIQKWIEAFHRNGYVVIPNVLSLDQCRELIGDLDAAATREGTGTAGDVYIYKKLFEHSDANLLLFDQEPVVTLAEALLNDPRAVPPGNNGSCPTALQCHVINNNGSIVPPRRAGVKVWHQDDPPHYIVTEGDPPTNVHFPPLFLTANYYLTDVTRVEQGPTAFVNGSHYFGRPCPVELDESQYEITCATGAPGTAVIFSSQVWHRGNPNLSGQARYLAQITYGRRIIGHKHYPFMNYQMPEHVVDYVSQSKRLKRLAGFLHRGPYG